MPPQKHFDQILPVEREFLLKERSYHLERLQDIEKRLNLPSSVLSRELRRTMQRAGRDVDRSDSQS
jgi:hypothetical protein